MYMLKGMSEEEKATHVRELASSFQEAVFWSLLNKTEKAIQQTGIANLLVGGGVAANLYLRKRMRSLVKKYKGSVYFPPFKFLTGDNAAMIGIAAYYQLQKEKAVLPQEMPDREPRLRLVNH
jgi:N6-L-threonylcarbamoyladenine synthase